MRPLAFALLLTALASQDEESIRKWILELEDESVDRREQAFSSLVQAGTAAEAALRKTAQSGTPEAKARAAEALQAIGWKRRYDPGPSLISIKRDQAALREVLADFQRQSPTPIDFSHLEAAVLDEPVSIILDKVPFYRALETLCREHPTIDYLPECGFGDGPNVRIHARPFASCPRVVDGALELRLLSITADTVVAPGGRASGETCFTFAWAWEKGTRPLTGRVEIDDLKDAEGTAYSERLDHPRESIQAQSVSSFLRRKMPCTPPDGVTRFSAIKGALVVVLPLTVEEATFENPATCIGKSQESRWGKITLAEFGLGTNYFHSKVVTRPEALVDRLTVRLLDSAGKELPGKSTAVGHMNTLGFLEFEHPKEENRTPRTLRCTAEVGRRERRIPFEFRDVRFR